MDTPTHTHRIGTVLWTVTRVKGWTHTHTHTHTHKRIGTVWWTVTRIKGWTHTHTHTHTQENWDCVTDCYTCIGHCVTASNKLRICKKQRHCAVFQVVSRRLLIAGVYIRSQASQCVICVTGTVFLRVHQFSFVTVLPLMLRASSCGTDAVWRRLCLSRFCAVGVLHLLRAGRN